MSFTTFTAWNAAYIKALKKQNQQQSTVNRTIIGTGEHTRAVARLAKAEADARAIRSAERPGGYVMFNASAL